MTEDTTDSTEARETLLSRRELLGTSAALGVSAIGLQQATGNVEAQTSSEPRITLGDDYVIDDSPDGNGDLVVEHTPSGAEFRYDSSADEWVIGGLDAAGVSINDYNLFIQDTEPTAENTGDVWIDNSEAFS